MTTTSRGKKWETKNYTEPRFCRRRHSVVVVVNKATVHISRMITLAWRKTYKHTRAHAARVFFSSTKRCEYNSNKKKRTYVKFSTLTANVHIMCTKNCCMTTTAVAAVAKCHLSKKKWKYPVSPSKKNDMPDKWIKNVSFAEDFRVHLPTFDFPNYHPFWWMSNARYADIGDIS